MIYIGDITYSGNMIRYIEFRCHDMDAMDCRYSWMINGKIWYQRTIYPMEYWIKHNK